MRRLIRMLSEAILGKVPPRLRPASACKNCKAFDSGTGRCVWYEIEVSEDYYCDAYEPTSHHQNILTKTSPNQ